MAMAVVSIFYMLQGLLAAEAIVICVDSKQTTNRIVELVTHEFPLAKVLSRSYDREHSLHLVKQKSII